MKWPKPLTNIPRTQTITKFLWLPKTLPNCRGRRVTRWLEVASFDRLYRENEYYDTCAPRVIHKDICWVDLKEPYSQ